MSSFVAAARRDGTFRRTAVAAVVLAAVLRFALGESWPYAVVVAAAASAAGLASDYADHRQTPTAVRHLWLGAALVAVAGGWVVVAESLPPVAAVGLTAGSWLGLDGWTARRADHPDASQPPGGDADDRFDDGLRSTFRTFREMGAVGRAIDRGAETPAAIAAELDRSVDAVEADLADLEAAGVVERVEPTRDGAAEGDDGAERYRQTDREWSVASVPRRLAARAARPFRLLVSA